MYYKADKHCKHNGIFLLQDDALKQIQSLVPLVDWNTALRVWSVFVDSPHSVTVPKPVTSTTTEECKHVQLAAEDLNVAVESCSVDCRTHTEQFCDHTNTENLLQDTENLFLGENCTVEESVDESYLMNGKKCTNTKNSQVHVLVGCDSDCDKTEEVSINAAEKSGAVKEIFLPSFRATCHRTGSHHCFQSPAAAAHFGGAVHDYFGWNVDLNSFDIEVVLCIEDKDMRIGISLTSQSLHRRHITHFGKTTLRPTIAHGMLR